jgi:PTS system galactitol-specific IIC component
MAKIVTIIIAVAVYLAIYLHFRSHRKTWFMAAGASEEYLVEKGYIEGNVKA